MRNTPTTPLRRHSKKPAARQRGFALMESLISILIFSFGVLGLLGLEARAINFSVDAEDRNRAALLASEVASTMWLTGTVALPAATLNAFNVSANTATNPATGLLNGVVVIAPVAGSVNSADITISWNEPSRADGDVLTTRVILP
jgi:type IV pilus assembly protein PilV